MTLWLGLESALMCISLGPSPHLSVQRTAFTVTDGAVLDSD